MSAFIKESKGHISGRLAIEAYVGSRRVFCEICTVEDRDDCLERAAKAVRRAAK